MQSGRTTFFVFHPVSKLLSQVVCIKLSCYRYQILTMFWVIFLLTLILYVVYRFLTFDAKYSQPPGPLRWPLVGHAFTVNTSQAAVFAQLAKDYRGLYSLSFFGKRFVVVSDARVIQNLRTSKAVTEKLFTHRPCDFLSKFTLLGRTTPYMEPSEEWISRRQVLEKKLKIYTGGLQLSESLLKQELGKLTTWIGSHKEKPVDLSPVLLASLVNTASILLLGKRFAYEGSEIKAVCDVILGTESLSSPRTDGLLQALPCLARLPVLWGATVKRLEKNLKLVQEYYYELPKLASKAGGSGGLMGLLMKTMEGNNNAGATPQFSEEDVMEMVIGVLTTSVPKMHATLMSFIWMTLRKPAIALKIQREVEKVTNSTRLPILRDRERMPYTEAAILELLRFSPTVPFSRHRVVEDTKLEEFQLRSNTTILTDLSSVNHDPDLWENPEKFMPERFLDASGRLLPENSEPRKNLQSFGIGQRSCIGQAFTLSRMFLYVATLLQQFNFRSPEDGSTPNANGPLHFTGSIAKPAPFHVKLFQHPYKVDFYRQQKS